MADITIKPRSMGAFEIAVNGMDLTWDVYAGSLALVDVDGELGLQMTLAIGRLDLGEGAK